MTRSNDAFAFGQLYSVSRPYAVNGLNQYTSAGPAGFAYDANGNLAGDGRTGFAYDGENRLVSASGGQTAVLRYDPLGRLYEVAGRGGITRFLWDGDALLAEYDAGGTLLRRYVHGADARTDDPVAWYEGSALSGASERLLRADWQGSIVLAADSTGTAAVALNSYDEWGIPGAGNQGRFQYTGQAWIPELGLYHYKARFYSPTLGRFLQTDPVGYDDQVNLYAYVGNDPVNKSDPLGLQQCVILDAGYDVWGLGSEGLQHNKFVKTGSSQFCMGGDSNGYSPQEQARQPGGPQSVPCSSGVLPVAWTPDGNTKGENPRPQGGRYNTDLPGGYEAAIGAFVGLSRLDGLANGADGGFRINRNPLRPTTAFVSDAGNVALRWAVKDGRFVWRIDINAGAFDLDKAETIHFNGSGRGNICQK